MGIFETDRLTLRELVVGRDEDFILDLRHDSGVHLALPQVFVKLCGLHLQVRFVHDFSIFG